jgi:hypothetical protein
MIYSVQCLGLNRKIYSFYCFAMLEMLYCRFGGRASWSTFLFSEINILTFVKIQRKILDVDNDMFYGSSQS